MNEGLAYYSAVIAVVLVTQITGFIVIRQNRGLKSEKRNSFLLTFGLLIWGTILEWSSYTVLTLDFPGVILIRKCVKSIELSIAPILIVKCTFNIFSIKTTQVEKILVKAILWIHMFLEILSIPFGFIFKVTEDNVYYHGEFYWIYILSLVIVASFLIYKMIEFCRYYQNQNLIVLVFIFLILGSGTVTRVINKDIRLDWMAGTFAIIFLYIYYSDISMHIDFLTKMLNQRSYNNELDLLTFPSIVIIFDIDNFKNVNDTHGHDFGDQMISLVGGMIKDVFQEYGKCFRIGGDEFAVIQNRNLDSVGVLVDELLARLNTKRAQDNRIPYISWGFAKYENESQRIKDIIKEADQNMYATKKANKNEE